MQNYVLPSHDNDEDIKREFFKEKFLWTDILVKLKTNSRVRAKDTFLSR
jgi:hypothetical protein